MNCRNKKVSHTKIFVFYSKVWKARVCFQACNATWMQQGAWKTWRQGCPSGCACSDLGGRWQCPGLENCRWKLKEIDE